MPFVLREYDPADFDTLWRIDQACFTPEIAYSRKELKIYTLRRGAFTLVAAEKPAAGPGRANSGESKLETRSSGKTTTDSRSDGSSIAGFIVAEVGPRGVGHIITIDVVAAARRSGVGSLLLSSAEDRLRLSGCHAVELETAVDNISALSFYKRHGYHVVRTFPRYYSNGVDALVLVKELKPVQL
ncbi:MAG TPA: N-acetyltransferase [Candidatus Binatia bacterium]|nr:N-acetyltransferase [Candidatus Binatia bacterium]